MPWGYGWSCVGLSQATEYKQNTVPLYSMLLKMWLRNKHGTWSENSKSDCWSCSWGRSWHGADPHCCAATTCHHPTPHIILVFSSLQEVTERKPSQQSGEASWQSTQNCIFVHKLKQHVFLLDVHMKPIKQHGHFFPLFPNNYFTKNHW